MGHPGAGGAAGAPSFCRGARRGLSPGISATRRSDERRTDHGASHDAGGPPALPGDDPTEAYYETDVKVGLGTPLPLPAPYPTLETASFLDED